MPSWITPNPFAYLFSSSKIILSLCPHFTDQCHQLYIYLFNLLHHISITLFFISTILPHFVFFISFKTFQEKILLPSTFFPPNIYKVWDFKTNSLINYFPMHINYYIIRHLIRVLFESTS